MTDITTTDTPGTGPPAAKLPWSVSLQLGSMWFELSVGQEPDLDALATQVDARIEREARLAVSRQDLIDMLVYFSRDATKRGVARGALRWTVSEQNSVSAATMYMTVFRSELLETADQAIEALQRRLAPQHTTDKTPPLVDVRDLPAGQAVRVQVISDNDPEPSDDTKTTVAVETVQYWLPLPGRQTVLLFTFSTPNLAASELLVAELDHMMENHVEVNLSSEGG